MKQRPSREIGVPQPRDGSNNPGEKNGNRIRHMCNISLCVFACEELGKSKSGTVHCKYHT